MFPPWKESYDSYAKVTARIAITKGTHPASLTNSTWPPLHPHKISCTSEIMLIGTFYSSICGEIAAPNHVAQIYCIVSAHIPINLPCIVHVRLVCGSASLRECQAAITVCLHRAVVAAAEHVLQRLRPCVAQLPAVAEIATIESGYQCHVGLLIVRSPILAPRHPAKNAECYQGSRPLRPVGNVLCAGLAAPYVRKQGHLMIWPPEHRYRWAGGGSTG